MRSCRKYFGQIIQSSPANLTSLRSMLPIAHYQNDPLDDGQSYNFSIRQLLPSIDSERHHYCAALRASSSVDSSLSGPKDMGKSCSSVMTVYLPSLSYINIGVLGYNSISQNDSKNQCTLVLRGSLHHRTRE
jgi:hypothetical protein